MSLVSCDADRLAGYYATTTYDLGELVCKTVTGDIYRSRDSQLVERYSTLSPYVFIKQLPDYLNSAEAVDILDEYLNKQNSIDFLATVSFLELENNRKLLIYDLPEGEMLKDYISRNASQLSYQQVGFLLINLKDRLEQLALVGMQHGRIEIDSIYMGKEGHLYLLDSAVVATKHELLRQDILSFEAVPNKEATTASLEVCFGRETSVRDNVFNLALLAYQLIYASHPYEGNNSVQALMKKSQVTRLNIMNDSQWRIFQKGLAFRAESRFASLEELIEAILCVNNPDGAKFHLVMNSASSFKETIKSKVWWVISASLGGALGAMLVSRHFL